MAFSVIVMCIPNGDKQLQAHSLTVIVPAQAHSYALQNCMLWFSLIGD